ncbi:MAG TPA: S8 family serine peptidase, partial [Bacteroidia bacterium]|nr:S8 family serine peptidase [Bacteroidia bacterium]
MMKKILALCTILAASLTAMSQAPTKFDFYLAQKQAAVAQGKIDGLQSIEVLVQGNIAAIQDLVQKCGGTFKYSYGNIAAIRIPLKALSSFYISNSIKRMEGAPSHMRVCNDTMRMHAHIAEVQAGMSPLTKEYKGKGVIIGMIDSGIDFVHPDFLDSLGKSRILAIWDMNKTVDAFTPSPYGYGREWDKATLDTALAHNIPSVIDTMDLSSTYEWGHGSHVSGVATSNGRANHTCIGAAPEADIMMVTFNFNVQTATEMTDATSFLFNKATAIGEPIVINASLGDYDGSHDGKDLQALMMDSMITAKPGRVFVAAAGNESSVPYHVQHTETPGDTSFTWFQYYSYNGQIVFDAWADTANFRQVQFAIGVDRAAPFSSITHTAFSTVLTNLGNIVTDTLKNSKG